MAAVDGPGKLPCTETAPGFGFRITVAEPVAVEAGCEEGRTSIAPVSATLYIRFAGPPAPPALPRAAVPAVPPCAEPPAPPLAEPPGPPAEPAAPPAAEPPTPPLA